MIVFQTVVSISSFSPSLDRFSPGSVFDVDLGPAVCVCVFVQSLILFYSEMSDVWIHIPWCENFTSFAFEKIEILEDD